MSFGCVQSIPKCTVGTICRLHPAPGQPFWADAATSSCPEWAARPGGAAHWQNRIDLGDSGCNHHSNNGSWILLILMQATGQLQRESFFGQVWSMGGRQSVDPLQSGCEKNRHLRADVHLLWHRIWAFARRSMQPGMAMQNCGLAQCGRV